MRDWSEKKYARTARYVCLKCHQEVELKIDLGTQWFRCPFCKSKIFIKQRPPIIKKISKIR